jgi:hypothetical protein
MTQALTRRRREYTPVEIDKALLVLAGCGGNSWRASEITGVPSTTLRDWRVNEHRDRYLKLADQERPRLEQLAVEDAIGAMMLAGEIEREIGNQLLERLGDEQTKPKEIAELAGALQRSTTSKGINGTKLLELTGRPTQVVEHRDGTQILEELKRIAPGLIIDSTAEEIPTRALSAESVSANARTGTPSA